MTTQEMCEMLQGALERRGYDVTTSQNADQALQLLQDKDFDVVATDLNMKGMSGIDLCRKVVANREDIPVVVITAFGSMETAVAAIRAGAYDFVTKPFEMDTLGVDASSAPSNTARCAKKSNACAARSKERAGFEDIIGQAQLDAERCTTSCSACRRPTRLC